MVTSDSEGPFWGRFGVEKKSLKNIVLCTMLCLIFNGVVAILADFYGVYFILLLFIALQFFATYLTSGFNGTVSRDPRLVLLYINR